MTYKLLWDNADLTIVRQVYCGSIGRRDMEAMCQESRQMLASVSHPVDLIVEWQERTSLLQDFSLISMMMFVEKHVPVNQRYVFSVDMSPMYRAICKTMERAAPKAMQHVHFVETVEQAYSLRSHLLQTALPVPS